MVQLIFVCVVIVLGLLVLFATPVIGACIVLGIRIHWMPATTRLRRLVGMGRPKPQRGDEPSDVCGRGVHFEEPEIPASRRHCQTQRA